MMLDCFPSLSGCVTVFSDYVRYYLFGHSSVYSFAILFMITIKQMLHDISFSISVVFFMIKIDHFCLDIVQICILLSFGHEKVSVHSAVKKSYKRHLCGRRLLVCPNTDGETKSRRPPRPARREGDHTDRNRWFSCIGDQTHFVSLSQRSKYLSILLWLSIHELYPNIHVVTVNYTMTWMWSRLLIILKSSSQSHINLFLLYRNHILKKMLSSITTDM